MFGWLPNLLQDRGLNAANAGYVLSVSVFGQAAGALFAPMLATCWRDQRAINVVGAAFCIAGLMGCFYAPLWSVWIWSGVAGLAQGGVFAVAVMLILLLRGRFSYRGPSVEHGARRRLPDRFAGAVHRRFAARLERRLEWRCRVLHRDLGGVGLVRNRRRPRSTRSRGSFATLASLFRDAHTNPKRERGRMRQRRPR